MQGILLVDEDGIRRPKSKKEVGQWVASDPENVLIEATSVFGNEYDGRVILAPDGEYHFVGPDPYTARNFYGTIRVTNGTAVVR